MTNPTLRVAAPDPEQHADALIELLDIDDPGIGEVARDSRILNSHYDWRASRIGFMGDTLVTHYGVYGLMMRVGVAEIPTAGVNMVVTHPDYRGRGLMAQTAQAATGGLRERGYQLSVICNAIENFYGRFGYVFGWPEVDALIKIKHLPSALPHVVLHPCEREHVVSLAALYNRDNAGVTGTVVRPTYPRGKHPRNGSACYWTDARGEPAGYVLYDIAEQTRTLWLDDSAGEIEQRLAVLAQLARQLDCVEMRCERLAPRGLLGRRLHELSCQWEYKYRQRGGWMVQIHNLPALFTALAPVLEARLSAAGLMDWRGDLLLADANERIVLSIHAGRISVEPAHETPHELLAGAHLAQFVVGTDSPEQLIANAPIEIGGDARWLLPILFPAQQPQLSNDDL